MSNLNHNPTPSKSGYGGPSYRTKSHLPTIQCNSEKVQFATL